LFAGEYTHLEFNATSADDVFFITAQGMDFEDPNWSFHLHAPDGSMVYGDGSTAAGHSSMQDMGCSHCCRKPHVTAKRSSARLSLLLQRDSAEAECWVGTWRLMVSYKARLLDGMIMFTPDSLMSPVAAGTLRGPRYARLLVNPKARVAQRNVAHAAANVFDILPPGSNRNDNEACDVAVNVYARTRLRYSLVAENLHAVVGDSISVQVQADVLQGNINTSRSFARMIAPITDVAALVPKLNPKKISPDELDKERRVPKFDYARALAELERQDPKLFERKDAQMNVAIHENCPLHVHIEKAPVAGPYNLSVYIEGEYCPDHDTSSSPAGHVHSAGMEAHQPESDCGPDCVREPYIRLLTTTVPVARKQPAQPELKAKPKK